MAWDSSPTLMPDSTDNAVRPHAADLDQLAERLALGPGGKAVEQLGILAHHEVGQQRDRLAERGQVVEGAHRHADLVAHAVAVDQHVGRVLEAEGSGELSDHGARVLGGAGKCLSSRHPGFR